MGLWIAASLFAFGGKLLAMTALFQRLTSHPMKRWELRLFLWWVVFRAPMMA